LCCWECSEEQKVESVQAAVTFPGPLLCKWLPGKGWLLLLEGKGQLHLSLIVEGDLALEIAPEVLEGVEELEHGSSSTHPSVVLRGRAGVRLGGEGDPAFLVQ
jgi:hypothetical protein